jgi:hypothetical protein
MTQIQDPIQQALDYMRYQGAKSFDDLTALIDRTGVQWSNALDGVSDTQATFQPQGEWCAKEVLGHLITANRGINQTIADLARVQSPRSAERAKAMGEISAEYETMDVGELRGEVGAVFSEITQLMASLEGSDKLDQSFPHPIFGPLNLKEWFAFHRVHAMDHIQQLDKIKADPAYPSS